eukprot:Opistho-2@28513
MHSASGYGKGYPMQSAHPHTRHEALAREDTSRIAHLYFAASRLAEAFHPGLRLTTRFTAEAHIHISAVSDAHWEHIKGMATHLLQVSNMDIIDVVDSERIISLGTRIFVVDEVAPPWGQYHPLQPSFATWGPYGAHPSEIPHPHPTAHYRGGAGYPPVAVDTRGAPMTTARMYSPRHAQAHPLGQGLPPLADGVDVQAPPPQAPPPPPQGDSAPPPPRAEPNNPQRHPSPRAMVNQPISSGGAHCIFCESGDRPGKLFKDLSRHMFRHFDAFEADGATGSHVLSIFHRVRYGDTQGLADIGTFWDAYADFVAGATGNSGGVRDTSEAAISIDDIISTGVLLSSGTFSSIFQCKSAPKGQLRADIVARVLSTIQYVGRESRIRAAKRLAAVTRTPRLFRTFVCTWWLEALRTEEIRPEDAGLTDEFWEAANDTGGDVKRRCPDDSHGSTDK